MFFPLPNYNSPKSPFFQKPFCPIFYTKTLFPLPNNIILGNHHKLVDCANQDVNSLNYEKYAKLFVRLFFVIGMANAISTKKNCHHKDPLAIY